MIDAVAWSVAPTNRALNRPRRLVSELAKLGVISQTPSVYHHGRSPSTDQSSNAGQIYPSLGVDTRGSLAVLSPVFQIREKVPFWIDYYDDWSLAPDINPIARALAKASYRRISHGKFDSATVTVNTQYMAMKLQLPLESVVPNGVDYHLSGVLHEGDDRNRMLVLGKLFSGRTDEALIREMSHLPWIEEVVFCGIGKDRKLALLLQELKQRLGPKVQEIAFVDPDKFGKIAGSKTFALIPHKVTDYTLSQDLMKAYLLSALGIPVVCPQLLWPRSIDREYAFLVNAGIDLQTNLEQWNSRPRPSEAWRSDLVERNSWARRAQLVAERISV